MSMVQFTILALVGPIQATTMLWPMEISENQIRVGPHYLPIAFHTER